MNRNFSIKCVGLFVLANLFTGFLFAQQNFYRDSSSYRITPLAVNTGFSEWGAFDYDGSIVFTSNRPKPRPSRLVHRTDKQTQADFYMLYNTTLDTTGKLEKVNRFAGELDSRYNVGPVYITPDEKTLVVTHNVKRKGEALKEKEKGYRTYVLQLFFYTRDVKHNKWSNVTAFQYNSNQYSCAHAFITPDGKSLFFSSDMPGTIGGMDIFVCQREETGWGLPKNMGKQVNSEKNDIFPSVSNDGRILYFSSDHAGGMGGLDVYRIDLPLTTENIAENVGAPVNSPYDDFGFVLYRNDEYGFLSSNRPLEMESRIDTSDNIYQVHILPPKEILYNIAVVDSLSGLPIPVDVTYRCLDCPDSGIPVSKSIDSGEQWKNVPLKPGQRYEFTITYDGFPPYSQTLVPDKGKTDITLETVLKSIVNATVIDSDEKPVTGANAMINDRQGKDYLYKTDNNGHFISIPFTGNRQLEITAGDADRISVPVIIDLSKVPAELKPEYTVILTLYYFTKMSLSAEVLFDFDKYNLTPRARKVLDTLSEALLRQPDVTVVLSGHTDSRGSADYNQKLSLNRAISVQIYLVSKGVKPDRIKVKAYGYSQLVNQCAKNVPCTEAEHQANRRVEFLFSKELELPKK